MKLPAHAVMSLGWNPAATLRMTVLHQQARQFGTRTLELFGGLITAVEQARASPPDFPLTQTYQAQLVDYRWLWANRRKPYYTTEPATWQTKCSTIGRPSFGFCNTPNCH